MGSQKGEAEPFLAQPWYDGFLFAKTCGNQIGIVGPLLKPDLDLLFVGDRATIGPDLSALNLGPVEIRDLEDNLPPQNS